VNILVTGSAGYVGSALIEELTRHGDTLYALDIKPPPKELTVKTHHIIQDITNAEALKEKLKPLDIDVVVHLAAQITGDPSQILRINVDGTANLLEALRSNQPKLVIIASTAAQLYRNAQYIPIDEKHPVTPVTPYGLSKHLAEEVARFYYRVHSTPTLIFRQANVYGPAPVMKDTVINKFLEQAAKERCISIFGDGKQVRNFIYINDLMQCYLKAIYHSKPETLAGETLNVAGSEEYQIRQLAKIVAKTVSRKMGRKVTVTYAPPSIPPTHEVHIFKISIEKAFRLLNYKPETAVEEGIEKILELYEGNKN